MTGILCLLLLGCGGVDRDRSIARVMDDLGARGLTEVQRGCVEQALRTLSDDDLEGLAQGSAPEAVQERFDGAVLGCATAPVPSAADAAD